MSPALALLREDLAHDYALLHARREVKHSDLFFHRVSLGVPFILDVHVFAARLLEPAPL